MSRGRPIRVVVPERAGRRARAARPRALWIRHTRHRARGRAEQARRALWCTVFDPAGGRAGGGQAVRRRAGRRVTARGPERVPRRGARARGRMAEWELTVAGGGAPLRHLAPGALYRLPLPQDQARGAGARTASSRGRVVLDGVARGRRRLARDGRPQLGPRARRALGLAARRRVRGRAGGVAGARVRPRARGRRAVARGSRTAPCSSAAVASGSAGSATCRACAWSPRPAAWRRSCPGERRRDPRRGRTPTSIRPSASPTPARGPTTRAPCCTRGWRGPARRAPPRPLIGRARHGRRRRLRARRARVERARRAAAAVPGPVNLKGQALYVRQRTRKARRLPSLVEKRPSLKVFAVTARV